MMKADKMKSLLASFVSQEEGAVTVDFVILTAMTCVLSLTVALVVTRGGVDLGSEVEASLAAQSVPASVTLPAAPAN